MTDYRIELRRDTAANWTADNPVLLSGEAAFESDTGKLKIGDGSTAYTGLPYFVGDLSGVITFSELPVGTTANTVAAGNDDRFTDTRVPKAHATSHASGGTDAVTLAQSQITGLTDDLAAKIGASSFTAKGSLLVGTGDGTFSAVTVGADGQSLIADSSQAGGVRFGTPGLMLTPTFSLAGPIVAMAHDFRWYNDTAQTLTIDSVRASLGAAPTGSSAIFDVLLNGSSIFTTTSNRPTIADSGFTAVSGVPDVTSVAAGDYLTVSVAQVGSTTPGSDLTLTILLH